MATSKAKQVELAERRAKAVKLRTAGQTWEAIAVELGYCNRGAAYKDVMVALDEARAELAVSTEQFRELSLQRLDAMRRKVQEVIDQAGAGAAALQAIDRLVKIDEREARLLGLDQAQKVEMSGQVLYAVEGVNTERLM